MDTDLIDDVSRALRNAATHKRILSYKKFHALFEPSVPLVNRYKILEVAISSLGDISIIDYSVLLACDNGLPGGDFFQRYRKYRLEEFIKVMGDPRYCVQKRSHQRLLVERERERVYQHAAMATCSERQCA
jgi:hypothetical protein